MQRPGGESVYSENMYFSNKKITYVWNVAEQNFKKQPHIDENMRQGHFHKCKEGLGQLSVADRLQEYGENLIRISVPGVVYLVFHEVHLRFMFTFVLSFETFLDFRRNQVLIILIPLK